MQHPYLLVPSLIRLESLICFERHYREKCIDSRREKDGEGGWVYVRRREMGREREIGIEGEERGSENKMGGRREKA